MIRAILVAVVALAAAVFALDNKQDVHLAFWPSDYVADFPLSLVLLVAMGVAFFLGALIVWPSALVARRRARRADDRARALTERLRTAEALYPSAVLPPPA